MTGETKTSRRDFLTRAASWVAAISTGALVPGCDTGVTGHSGYFKITEQLPNGHYEGLMSLITRTELDFSKAGAPPKVGAVIKADYQIPSPDDFRPLCVITAFREATKEEILADFKSSPPIAKTGAAR